MLTYLPGFSCVPNIAILCRGIRKAFPQDNITKSTNNAECVDTCKNEWKLFTSKTLLTLKYLFFNCFKLLFWNQCLKLVYTNLSNREIGTTWSTAAIFLSDDHCLYSPITSNKCHAWFHLYGLSRHARSAWKAEKKYKIEKWLPIVELELSSSPASSVDRGSVNESQGCGFDSHCWQFYFCIFFHFHALLAGRLRPYKWIEHYIHPKYYM